MTGWQEVASEEELAATDGWLRVRLDDEPWLVVRLDGALSALRDECPHRRVPLSAGERHDDGSGEAVACGYHGWRFSGDGRCTAIPALGPDAAVPRGMAVRAAPAAVRDGKVWVCRP